MRLTKAARQVKSSHASLVLTLNKFDELIYEALDEYDEERTRDQTKGSLQMKSILPKKEQQQLIDTVNKKE